MASCNFLKKTKILFNATGAQCQVLNILVMSIGSSWEKLHTLSTDFTSIYCVATNSDGGQNTQHKDTLTAELLLPSRGASGQHICKHTAEHKPSSPRLSLCKSQLTCFP